MMEINKLDHFKKVLSNAILKSRLYPLPLSSFFTLGRQSFSLRFRKNSTSFILIGVSFDRPLEIFERYQVTITGVIIQEQNVTLSSLKNIEIIIE